MSDLPTAEEFEAYLDLIDTIKCNKYWLLPNITNDRETNMRIWIIQRQLYFGGV